LKQSFEYTPKVKRLVHYRNGITMADTLGGSYIAVKPHFVRLNSVLPITTPVAQCGDSRIAGFSAVA
jgi:hypothetical protein